LKLFQPARKPGHSEIFEEADGDWPLATFRFSPPAAHQREACHFDVLFSNIFPLPNEKLLIVGDGGIN
jgi:hypothetical protein